jgi:hypothetical protein
MSTWLKINTKSVLIDTTLRLNCETIDNDILPIEMRLHVIELNYGPVLNFKIISDIPYNDTMYEHPFMYSKEYMSGEYKTGSIIDDTPAVRALINELVDSNKTHLYTTTHCTHVARLIRAINGFWS